MVRPESQPPGFARKAEGSPCALRRGVVDVVDVVDVVEGATRSGGVPLPSGRCPAIRPADPTISRAVGSASTGTRRRWRWSRTRCTCRRRARGGGDGSGRTGSRGRRTSCRTIRSASRRRCARGGGRVRTGSRGRRTCYCSVCIECSWGVLFVSLATKSRKWL